MILDFETKNMSLGALFSALEDRGLARNGQCLIARIGTIRGINIYYRVIGDFLYKILFWSSLIARIGGIRAINIYYRTIYDFIDNLYLEYLKGQCLKFNFSLIARIGTIRGINIYYRAIGNLPLVISLDCPSKKPFKVNFYIIARIGGIRAINIYYRTIVFLLYKIAILAFLIAQNMIKRNCLYNTADTLIFRIIKNEDLL